MPAGINSTANIGVRRVIRSLTPPQYRNCEVNGTQLYKVMRAGPYLYGATTYLAGQTVAYDAAGGTKYGNMAQIERDFASAWLDPID
jgi:hypothetical protein